MPTIRSLVAAALILIPVAGLPGCEKQSSAGQPESVRLPSTAVQAKAPPAGSADPIKELGGTPAAKAEGQGEGPQPGGKNYELKVTPPADVKVGVPGQVEVLLKPTNGYKVNLEFPIRLKVEAPAGVKVAKAEQQKGDAKVDEKTAAFQVGFTAEGAGSKAFAADFHFSVCTPKFCEIKKERLSWSIAAN